LQKQRPKQLITASIFLLLWSGASIKPANSTMAQAAGDVHIVHVERSEQHANDAENYHLDILASVVGSKEAAQEAMLYSYNQAMNGFSAKLTPEQVKALQEKPEVIQVTPNRVHTLHDANFAKGVGGPGPRRTTVGGVTISSLGGPTNL
jgi:hypothetical protein